MAPAPPPLAKTLPRCIDELGVLPSGSLLLLRQWAMRRGIPVGLADRRNEGAVYEQCRRRRTAEGRWTPEKRTPVNKAPSLDGLESG